MNYKKYLVFSSLLAYTAFLAPSGQALAADANENMTRAKNEIAIRNYNSAIPLLLSETKVNNPEAQYLLAKMYKEGHGLTKDKYAAFSWFLRAAQNGYTPAMYNLGLMYMNGEGVDMEKNLGLNWITNAGNNNDPEAQYYLGVYYLESDPPRNTLAVLWLQKASQNGYADASMKLFSVYDRGRYGVGKNEMLAKHFLTKAAEGNNGEAMYRLAEMQIKEAHENGEELAMDKLMALAALLRSSQTAGYPLASRLLPDVEIKLESKLLEQQKAEEVEAHRDVSAQKIAADALNPEENSAPKEVTLAEDTKQKIDSMTVAKAPKFLVDEPPAPTNELNLAETLYEEGYLLFQDKRFHDARAIFQRSAMLGDPKAEYILGIIYQEGLGVKQDSTLALNWFEASAKKNYSPAQYSLGVMYSKGLGIEPNPTLAYNWIKQAADAGFIDAVADLGVMTINGMGVKPSQAEGVALLESAALKGKRETQFMLGQLYFSGTYVEKNQAIALGWFLEAGRQGHVLSQYMASQMYMRGIGTSVNYRQAHKWLMDAAVQGHVQAQAELGAMYYLGEVMNRNYQEAMRWFESAARQGHTIAQYNLGSMYYLGRGTTENYEMAYKWTKEAADQNHPEALYNLSVMTELGHGIEPNPMLAKQLYNRALNAGYQKGASSLMVSNNDMVSNNE